MRVSLLAADAVRERGLAALVEAVGHVVVNGVADVVLADAGALPVPDMPGAVAVVVLGEVDPDAPFAGVIPAAPDSDQLDAALRAAAAGLVVRTMPPRPEPGFRAADELHPLLTPREIEVLAAIGQGLSNKAVARRLGISAHTVKFHLEAAFRKLGASSRAEAVAKGLQRGLVEL
ncbi:MAG TPA: helix-turn-helix transcriptional regulator [Acetobacteraceae bacterium]|nr:helix-turn-helix transcriptional regulator [Acetobacteraceae bacterium]